MEELRLPRNNREGLLYGGVIAAITAFIMILFNMCKSLGGVEPEYIVQTIICLPLVWVVVMILMSFLVGRVADRVVRTFSSPSDSTNARIFMNIVCCVAMMSVIMTAVGPLVSSVFEGSLNLSGFENWLSNWPVNFCLAFWVEMLVAQPAARAVMRHIHLNAVKGGVVND